MLRLEGNIILPEKEEDSPTFKKLIFPSQFKKRLTNHLQEKK